METLSPPFSTARYDAALEEFVRAVAASDVKAFPPAFGNSLELSYLAEALPKILDLNPSPELRRLFRSLWVRYAYRIRDEAGHRDMLLAALRVLMPRFRGAKSIRVYRGANIAEWNTPELIGCSWTTKIEIARGFMGGSIDGLLKEAVLLSAIAPPEAIITRIGRDDDVGEAEVVVDPRVLRDIEVLERCT